MSDDNKQQALAEKELGNQAYKQRKFEDALAHYDKAWELDNTNVTILTNKAEAVELGRELRADYKLIARALQRAGNAYVKLDNLDEAIKFYGKSLTEHRTPETLQKLRDTEKQKKENEKAAYFDPALADKAREEGNALFKQSKWPEAIEQYTEAIKRNDKDARPYSNRAACYLKLMAINEAQKDADKCVELDPSFVRGYIRKAAVEFAKKEYQKAVDVLKEAQEHDVDGKCSREIQQQLMKAYTAMNPMSAAGAGGAGGEESQEEVLKRAAQDPEIQRILSDPVMQQILQQMQQDPKAAQEHLKNPQVAANIRKLMTAGILRVA
ncbi:Stress-induced-phosphoprotein 1 [Apophysomyces sp. BC1021]|nr:Stress-induced-phosphoprotein 1 [Apophysomyces sp. BC1021]